MRRPALYEVTFRNLLFTLFVFLGLSAHATHRIIRLSLSETRLKRRLPSRSSKDAPSTRTPDSRHSESESN